MQTFQNPPFWPNAFDRRAFGKPSTIDTNQTTTAADGDYADITATTEMENSLIEGNSTDESIGIDKRSIEDGNMQWRNEMKLLGSDVTAAQLYESVEENLMGSVVLMKVFFYKSKYFDKTYFFSAGPDMIEHVY